VVVSYLDQTL